MSDSSEVGDIMSAIQKVFSDHNVTDGRFVLEIPASRNGKPSVGGPLQEKRVGACSADSLAGRPVTMVVEAGATGTPADPPPPLPQHQAAPPRANSPSPSASAARPALSPRLTSHRQQPSSPEATTLAGERRPSAHRPFTASGVKQEERGERSFNASAELVAAEADMKRLSDNVIRSMSEEEERKARNDILRSFVGRSTILEDRRRREQREAQETQPRYLFSPATTTRARSAASTPSAAVKRTTVESSNLYPPSSINGIVPKPTPNAEGLSSTIRTAAAVATAAEAQKKAARDVGVTAEIRNCTSADESNLQQHGVGRLSTPNPTSTQPPAPTATSTTAAAKNTALPSLVSTKKAPASAGTPGKVPGVNDAEKETVHRLSQNGAGHRLFSGLNAAASSQPVGLPEKQQKQSRVSLVPPTKDETLSQLPTAEAARGQESSKAASTGAGGRPPTAPVQSWIEKSKANSQIAADILQRSRLSSTPSSAIPPAPNNSISGNSRTSLSELLKEQHQTAAMAQRSLAEHERLMEKVREIKSVPLASASTDTSISATPPPAPPAAKAEAMKLSRESAYAVSAEDSTSAVDSTLKPPVSHVSGDSAVLSGENESSRSAPPSASLMADDALYKGLDRASTTSTKGSVSLRPSMSVLQNGSSSCLGGSGIQVVKFTMPTESTARNDLVKQLSRTPGGLQHVDAKDRYRAMLMEQQDSLEANATQEIAYKEMLKKAEEYNKHLQHL